MISQRVKTFAILGSTLLLLVMLTSWMTPWLTHKSNKGAESLEEQMDEYMGNARVKRYNASGKLIQTLQIGRAFHLQGESFMRLESPELEIHRDDGALWFICSTEGKSYHKGESFDTIDLGKEVIVQIKDGPGDMWRMETDQLTILPPLQLASTHAPVVITSNNMTLRAKGMRGNLNSGMINFNSQVKNTYERS